ncbi:MAG TPA: hypothetical protein GX503_02390 [Clostridiales bacterium]|nr:hypothetical protein [Clostridiales bacterium]
MKKRYIHIYQCKRLHHILAHDIYDDVWGILILPKYTVLDEDALKRLKSFKIRQLIVYEPDTEMERPLEA